MIEGNRGDFLDGRRVIIAGGNGIPARSAESGRSSLSRLQSYNIACLFICFGLGVSAPDAQEGVYHIRLYEGRANGVAIGVGRTVGRFGREGWEGWDPDGGRSFYGCCCTVLRGAHVWSNDTLATGESKESMHSYGSFCLTCCSKNCTRKKELAGAFPAREQVLTWMF